MKRKYITLIPILILNIISIIYLPNPYNYRQIIWTCLSLLTLYLIKKINPIFIKKLIIPLYIVSNILLLCALIFSKFTNGSKGWINLGPINFQPSEITKISLILISILFINTKNKKLFILIYLLPSILTFLEPDTGAVIIYGIIFLTFLPFYFSKKQIIIFFTIILSIILLFFTIYKTNEKLFIDILGTNMYYRIDRLISFQNNNNLQTKNALISIGANKLLYFPESNNDFFFSYCVSKNSYLFFIIIILYLIFIISLINYNNYISNSILYIYLFQIIENIGMNLSILPVIGIPLPFFSYGGSHLLTSYILIGLTLKKMSLTSNNNHNMN